MPDPAYHELVRSVVAATRGRCAVPGDASVVVACSGGADSVALLRAVHGLSGRRGFGWAVTAAHVEHGLRVDGSAEADAAFVRGLADALGVRCVAVRLDPSERTDEPAMRNDEAWARRARYAALRRVAEDAGAGVVMTAHTADDQVETVLMAVLRGTGADGLRGIAWRRGLVGPGEGSGVALVRPMLGVRRGEVEDYLRALGQAWREDPTNADATKRRARLRRDVMPVLWELSPRLHERVQGLIDGLA